MIADIARRALLLFMTTSFVFVSGAGADATNVINTRTNAALLYSELTTYNSDVELTALNESAIRASIASVSVGVGAGALGGIFATGGEMAAK